MSAPKSHTRRNFLITTAAVGGALVVGWGMLPPRSRLGDASILPKQRGELALNGWVKISVDGTVTIAVPRAEMGQGVTTSLPMLLADELEADWSRVRFEFAPVNKIYGNVEMLVDGSPMPPRLTRKIARELGLQITGGSSSVRDAWEPMRHAGASAREMLVAAAATRFNAKPEECVAANGWVTHKSGVKASYGELVEAASKLSPPAQPKLKDPKDFRLIGKSVPRTDLGPKVDGTAQFGTDVRLPGMLYAAIRISPVLGGSWERYQLGAVEAMPGVKKVVGQDNFVAVIAESWWQAKQAVDALPVTWSADTNLDSARIKAQFANDIVNGPAHTWRSVGHLSEGFDRSARIVEAEYSAPFLAHATMEPINCTAQVANGRCAVWVSTQAPDFVRMAAAKAAGVDKENVDVHQMLLGGGFGRRSELDMVQQAVAIAKQADGKPVQLLWSREEDMRHDMYRPAALAKFRAGISGEGKVTAWWNRSVSGSVTGSLMQRMGSPDLMADKTTAEGAADMPYEIPVQKVEHVVSKTPVPLGFWRSVGHSHQAFFVECFLDELAAAAGKDAYEYRRALLANHPRHLAVLELAATKAGWGKPLEKGAARGIALHESFGSIVVQVAEVSLGAENSISVRRVVCAIDCGTVINPDIVAAQMESGIVFGLTAALYGEISIKGGKVEQSNFTDYRMLKLAEMPVVETHIVPSSETPGGVGEAGTPPIAPAVANAVFALTGKRLRSLPLKIT